MTLPGSQTLVDNEALTIFKADFTALRTQFFALLSMLLSVTGGDLVVDVADTFTFGVSDEARGDWNNNMM